MPSLIIYNWMLLPTGLRAPWRLGLFSSESSLNRCIRLCPKAFSQFFSGLEKDVTMAPIHSKDNEQLRGSPSQYVGNRSLQLSQKPPSLHPPSIAPSVLSSTLSSLSSPPPSPIMFILFCFRGKHLSDSSFPLVFLAVLWTTVSFRCPWLYLLLLWGLRVYRTTPELAVVYIPRG